jgi:hypothetical protein
MTFLEAIVADLLQARSSTETTLLVGAGLASHRMVCVEYAGVE